MRLFALAFAAALLATPALAQSDPFAGCQACHSLEKGKNMMGPSLAGIVGAKEGVRSRLHLLGGPQGQGRRVDAR